MKLEKIDSIKLTTEEITELSSIYDMYDILYSITGPNEFTTYVEILDEDDYNDAALYGDVAHIISGIFSDFIPNFNEFCRDSSEVNIKTLIMMLGRLYIAVHGRINSSNDTNTNECNHDSELSEKGELVEKLIAENDKLRNELAAERFGRTLEQSTTCDHGLDFSKKLSEKEQELSEKTKMINKLIAENDKLTKALIDAVAANRPTFLKPPFNPTCSIDDLNTSNSASNPSVSTTLTSDKINLMIVKTLDEKRKEDERFGEFFNKYFG